MEYREAPDPVPDGQPLHETGDLFATDPAAVKSASVHPVPASSGPRYCRNCGAPFDPSRWGCPVCEARAVARADYTASSGRGNPVVHALGLYFAFLLTILAAAITIQTGSNEARVILVTDAVTSVLTLVCCFTWRRSLLPVLRNMSSPGYWAAAVGIGIISFGVSWVVVLGLRTLFRLPEDTLLAAFWEAGYGWGVVLLVTCVQPAIIEELAFRGVILSALRFVLDVREAILVSALLFMVLHLSVLNFPDLFLTGLVLGYLRTRTDSLYPCILLHFTHNFLCVLVGTL